MRTIIGWVKCELCGRVGGTYNCQLGNKNISVCIYCGTIIASLKDTAKCSIPYRVKKTREKTRLEPDAEILKRLSSIGSRESSKR